MIGLRRRARVGPGVVETRRLRLVPITPELIEAEAEGHATLARVLGAEVGPEWPPQHWDAQVRAHILAQFAEYPESVGWHRYVVLTEPNQVVGCLGAFPCAAGDVEIGYSVLRSYQRRGLWRGGCGSVCGVAARAAEHPVGDGAGV